MSVTGTQLIAGAKALCTASAASINSAPQWLTWVNEAGRELHGLVASACEDTFYTEVDFTIAANVYKYTLPAAFMRIKGLDLDPDTDNQKSVRRFNFGERNDANRTVPATYPWCSDRRYRVVSRTQLIIEPRLKGPGNYRMYYIKRFIDLTAVSDTLQDELDPWYEYIHVVAGIKALAGEESDPSALINRRDVIRQDIEQSAPTDAAEADTITDVTAGAMGFGWMR